MQPLGNASTSSGCVRTRGLPPAMTFTKEALVRTGFAAFCSSRSYRDTLIRHGPRNQNSWHRRRNDNGGPAIGGPDNLRITGSLGDCQNTFPACESSIYSATLSGKPDCFGCSKRTISNSSVGERTVIQLRSVPMVPDAICYVLVVEKMVREQRKC